MIKIGEITVLYVTVKRHSIKRKVKNIKLSKNSDTKYLK